MAEDVSGRKTPPGSPPTQKRRSSSGFIYPVVGPSGDQSNKTVFYDHERGVLLNGSKNSTSGFATGESSKGNNKTVTSLKTKSVADARRLELEEAKRLIDHKGNELNNLKIEMERLRTEATRRASQARLFRESEAKLRTELENAKSEIAMLRDQLQNKNQQDALLSKRVVELEETSKNLSEQNRRLANENDKLRALDVQHVSEIAQLRLQLAEAKSPSTKEAEVVEVLKKEVAEQQQRILNLEKQMMSKQHVQTQVQPVSTNSTRNPLDQCVELVVKVALPGNQQADFLVRLDLDDPIRVVENFAKMHRLSPQAFQKLKAFTLAEYVATKNM